MGTTTASLAGPQYRIPYTQRDFQSIMDAIKANIPNNVPEWNDFQYSNYGIFLLSTVAALCDWLSFYVDRNAAEAFILTSISKSSIVNVLQLLNYQTRNAVPAYTTLRISLPTPNANEVLIPLYTEFSDASGTNRFITVLGASISAGDTYVDVPARQAEWATQNFTSDGTPQQRLILSQTNIADGFLRVWVGQREWTQALDNTFAGSGPTDQTFRIIVNAIPTPGPLDITPATSPDLVVTSVEFGDGLEGAIPLNGAPIRIDFATTQGDSTRVPAGAVNQVVDTILDILGNPVATTVTNLQSASGGDSAESIYTARKNYPQRFRTLNRAVTSYDFQVYAQSFPGVLMAQTYDVSNNADSDSALTPAKPVPVEQAIPFYQVRIYCIPRSDWSSEALNFALQQWLAQRTIVDREIVVLSPTTAGINIQITLRTYSNFDANAVKSQVVQAVQSYFTLTNGGDIQIGSTFFQSRLILLILQIPGVSSIDMTANLTGQPPSASDVIPGFGQIIQLASLTVTLPSTN